MRRRSKEIRIAVAVSDFVKLDLVNNPTLIMFSLIECEFILRGKGEEKPWSSGQISFTLI